MSRSLSRVVAGGLASLAALGLTASTAEAAQTAKLDYRCKFPLLGTQPLKLDITLDVPDSVRSGEPTAPFAITAVASVGGTGVPPLEPFGEVRTIGGVTDAQQPGKGTAARARVELADGSGINVRVPINVEPSTLVTPVQYPLVMNATGQAPSLTLDVPGMAKITLTELILNLYGRYDDGTPVEGLTTPPTDIDRQPYADIDGDPGTFNVPCKLDPATQNPQLATVTIGHSDPCEISDSCPNQPPSKPGRPSATSTGTDRVTLFWNQATDDRGVTGYDVFRGETKVATVPNNSPYTVTGLTPDTTYEFRVEAFDAEGARTSSDTVTLRTGADLPGRQKTTVNYRCKFPLIGTSPVAFEFGLDVPDTWPVGAPTAPFPVNVRAKIGANIGISIIDEGFELSSVSDSQTGSSLRLSVVPPNGSAIATRVALDFEPLSLVPPIPYLWVLTGSGTLPSLTVNDPGTTRIDLVAPEFNLRLRSVDGSPVDWWTTPPTDIDRQPYRDIDGDPTTANVPCKPDPADQNMQLASFDTLGEPANLPPTKPVGLKSTATQNSVALSWDASTDPDGTVDSYNVYQGSAKVATVTGTTATISGLSPDVAYSFSVEAVDNDEAVSERSAALLVTTKVPPTTPEDKHSYAVAGSVKLATLVRGSLALKGSADLTFSPPANLRTVSGTLDLGQSSGRLVALGFLPVTAKVGFVSSGSATGLFGGFGATLTLSQKVRIKVLEAKLFGAIPLIAGNNCQTRQLTSLGLSSPDPFSPRGGGTLTGTFAISDLNGCGALNGLVSPLTAGGGNTIAVTLTPKAS